MPDLIKIDEKGWFKPDIAPRNVANAIFSDLFIIANYTGAHVILNFMQCVYLIFIVLLNLTFFVIF